MSRAPIFIELALWYYTTPGDHPSVDLNAGAPAYNETAQQLLSLGLLMPNPSGASIFKGTEGLTVYVEALGNVPTPVKRWVMPNEN